MRKEMDITAEGQQARMAFTLLLMTMMIRTSEPFSISLKQSGALSDVMKLREEMLPRVSSTDQCVDCLINRCFKLCFSSTFHILSSSTYSF